MDKRIVIIVLILLLIIGGLFFFFIGNKEEENYVDIFVKQSKTINILLAGSNRFNDNKHSFFALASINSENSKIGITFIPGEFEVDIDNDGNPVTLNNYTIDNYNKMLKALSKTLKLNVPFYISFYSPDVAKVVNIIEGVNLYVLNQTKDIFGIKNGLNFFDGERIVEYINNVESNSIFEKYDRIQDVFLTLYGEKEKYAKFVNPFYIELMLETTDENMSANELLSLSKILLAEGDLFCSALPGSYSKSGTFYMDEIAYKIYETNFIKKLLFEEEGEKSINIRILNATDIPGFARKTRYSLIREGISVVEFATSPYGDFDESVLINRNGNISAVETISEFTGINNVYHITDSTELSDVTLILGKDYQK